MFSLAGKKALVTGATGGIGGAIAKSFAAAGAQVAVNGEGAVGAAIEVWWSGDQRFYPGMVAKYDHVSQEHAVIYQVSRDEAVRALSRNVKLQSSR